MTEPSTTQPSDTTALPEFAYYYPEPFWAMNQGDWLKTLLLFFDGIAILLPRYMRGRHEAADPVLAGPLEDRGLLKVLEPETFIDQQTTESLSDCMVNLITSGVFDDLDRDIYYQELSASRMGWDSDVELASMVIEELRSRDLARASEDGASVPLHPEVRRTVLVLLSQLNRAAGRRNGLDLHPVTDRTVTVDELLSTLGREPMPSAGHVVALDLEAVTLNLETVPLDEVLDFREEYGPVYRAYARDLRRFLSELSRLQDVNERNRLLLDRREELADRAHELRRTAQRAWRHPLASFALGIGGAAWSTAQQNIPQALLTLGQGLLDLSGPSSQLGHAFSYLFHAQRTLSR